MKKDVFVGEGKYKNVHEVYKERSKENPELEDIIYKSLPVNAFHKRKLNSNNEYKVGKKIVVKKLFTVVKEKFKKII